MAVSEVVDLESLRDWIVRSLGAPVLKVELHEDMVDDAILDAMDWFSDKLGIESIYLFNIIDGQSEYDLNAITGLPTDPPSIQDTVNVIFEAPDTILRDDFGFLYGAPFCGGYLSSGAGATGGRYGFGSRGYGYTYSYILQWLQTIETAKRILSAERSWEYDKFSGILRVFPVPSLTTRGAVIVKRRVTITGTAPEFGKLVDRYRRLIKDYSLAGSMLRLARIRGKYDGIPAAGRDFSLNADALMTEAKDMIEKADTEIASLAQFSEIGPIIIG